MKEGRKNVKQEAVSISRRIQDLTEEIENRLPSSLQDPGPLRQTLTSFSAEELEELFLALLKKGNEQILPLLQTFLGQEEKVDLALARTLGRWNSPQGSALLHPLASSTSSKKVMKSIRRSIFQLRSQGWEVKDIEDSSPSVYRPPQPASPEGFLSFLDPAGTRLVWLLRPQPAQGALAFHGLISDLQGIIDFNGFETSRNKFHEYLKEFQKGVPWEIVEADPEYCHG